MLWLLDFDDTLAVGPVTWALQVAFPELIETHQLPFEAATFNAAMLYAQQKANEEGDELAILAELFDRMGWDSTLKGELVSRIFDQYVPTLFEDTLPFLQRIAAASQRVYIVSNNNHAGDLASMLGIAPFIDEVFTPKSCGGVQPKPQRTMWNFILSRTTATDAAIVGDDPWSDGVFAQHCNIGCWLVDRMQRFTHLYQTLPYRWVHSLNAVTP